MYLVGKYKDYIAEIRQSYELGVTPYRLHTNVDGTFLTPIREYVLNDVATMMVTNRYIAADNLVYFVKSGDGGGGDIVALHGDRGPSGARGLKGDSGDRGPAVSRGPTGKRGVQGPGGPTGNIGKMGPVGVRGGAGTRGGKGDKGDTSWSTRNYRSVR